MLSALTFGNFAVRPPCQSIGQAFPLLLMLGFAVCAVFWYWLLFLRSESSADRGCGNHVKYEDPSEGLDLKGMDLFPPLPLECHMD